MADIKFLFGWAKENNITLPTKSDGYINIPEALNLYAQWKKNHSDNSPSENIKEVSDDKETSNKNNLREAQDISGLLGKEYKGIKGQAAVNKLIETKQGHVKNAFHRDDIGDIALIWGNEKCGLKHILMRREEQGINVDDFIKNITDVVEKGAYRKQNKNGNYELLYKGKMAIVSPELQGNKMTFLLTAYKTSIKK